jgi:hypothetical protein
VIVRTPGHSFQVFGAMGRGSSMRTCNAQCLTYTQKHFWRHTCSEFTKVALMVIRTLPAGVDTDITSVGVVDMAETTQLQLAVLQVVLVL